jgi:uncharacterized protein YcbX
MTNVAAVWQYPVKSMVGMEVREAVLTASGMEGDRRWAVRDDERGGIRGARKIPSLMRLTARPLDDLHVEITSPTGEVVRSDAPDIHERLSAMLGHRVTLCPLRPASDVDHYRRGAGDTDDIIAELRAIFGRDADEPLPDLSIFPPALMEFETPPGTYVDAFPLMLMTTGALDALTAALPDSRIDVRRFRPNLVLDAGTGPGHPEFGWVGQRWRIGTAELEIVERCPRCVMVTQQVAGDLPADRAVLRHIVRDLDQNVGVYAHVVAPGVVARGDTAERIG